MVIFRRLIVGIGNIIRWFPVIWNDRDWDNSYLYIMLHRKRESMYDFFTDDERTMAIHHKNHIKKLLICKLLIERILDQGYLDRALTPYRNKYESSKIIREVDSEGWVHFYGGEREELWDRCSEHSYYMEQQDYKMLHELLAKYSDAWWD